MSREMYWIVCFSKGKSSLPEFTGEVSESAAHFDDDVGFRLEPAQLAAVAA